MDSKDARESLESGGGGARCHCSNVRRKLRKATAVFVIQSLIIAICAAFSLYIYLSQLPGSNKHDNGIYLQMNLDLDSEVLEFDTLWNQSIALNDKKTVKLSCGGPYMVYLSVCVTKLKTEAVANLTIKTGNKLFHLQTLQDKECKEMQKVIMLHKEKDVTVIFERAKDTFRISELYLGLHYMLGSQCFPSPVDDEG